jgi:branched-chain amino acid transport system permease protein
MSVRVAVDRSTRASRVGAIGGGIGVILLAVGPLLWEDTVLRMLVQFFYLLALAQMWNLLAGYAGLVSIGQQAYVGIGAYALLWFVNTLGVNVFVAVPLAGVVAATLSVPTAALVFRLRGGYFAIGTWVVAEVYRVIVANTQQLGGGSGATIRVVGIDPTSRLFATYWLALALGVGSVLIVYVLLRSRLGLALRAVRDREEAAATLGVDVLRTKVIVYVLASTICGLTGAVIYLTLLRVQPAATFSVNWTAFMIFAVVIGGIGTVSGPIVGTLVFFLLQEYLADLGAVYLIIVGVIAVVVVLRLPRGIWGFVIDRWDVRLFPEQIRVRQLESGTPTSSRSDEGDG